MPWQGEQIRPLILAKIKIPTLLLCGEDDRLTPPDVMELMAEQIPGSQFDIVPGAGHMSPIENASFVNSRIKKFLGRIYDDLSIVILAILHKHRRNIAFKVLKK